MGPQKLYHRYMTIFKHCEWEVVNKVWNGTVQAASARQARCFWWLETLPILACLRWQSSLAGGFTPQDSAQRYEAIYGP